MERVEPVEIIVVQRHEPDKIRVYQRLNGAHHGYHGLGPFVGVPIDMDILRVGIGGNDVVEKEGRDLDQCLYNI